MCKCNAIYRYYMLTTNMLPSVTYLYYTVSYTIFWIFCVNGNRKNLNFIRLIALTKLTDDIYFLFSHSCLFTILLPSIFYAVIISILYSIFFLKFFFYYIFEDFFLQMCLLCYKYDKKMLHHTTCRHLVFIWILKL